MAPWLSKLTLGTSVARCHAEMACGSPASESTWGQRDTAKIKIPHSTMWPMGPGVRMGQKGTIFSNYCNIYRERNDPDTESHRSTSHQDLEYTLCFYICYSCWFFFVAVSDFIAAMILPMYYGKTKKESWVFTGWLSVTEKQVCSPAVHFMVVFILCVCKSWVTWVDLCIFKEMEVN